MHGRDKTSIHLLPDNCLEKYLEINNRQYSLKICK